MENNKVAAIYCRVSTEDQATHGISIEAQERVCGEVIEKEGYALLEVIKDEGKSGGNLNRAGIKRLKELCEKKLITAVFMVHADRLSRNTADYIGMMDFFKEKGVMVRFVYQPTMDRSTATGQTMDTVMAVFNEHFRLTIKEKTKATLDQKAKAGLFPGTAPLGYMNVDNPSPTKIGKRIIAPDPVGAPFVQEAFKLYATGNYNGFELNEMMYRKGFRTKRGLKVHLSRFYGMLVNPIYVGELHWGDIHLSRAQHEPLIDRDLFDKVQRVMAAHNKHATRKRKYTFLLRGFLRCQEHRDRKYTAGHTAKPSGLIFSYYHCTNRFGCAGGYVDTDTLEGEVALEFKRLKFSESFTNRVIGKAKAEFDARRKSYEQKIARLDGQRNKLFARRKIAETKMFSGVLSDDDFTRIRQEIADEVKVIDGEKAKLEQQDHIRVDIAQEITAFMRDMYATYKKAHPIQQRHYLNLFFEHLFVYKGKVQEVAWSGLFASLLNLQHIEQQKTTGNMDPVKISYAWGARRDLNPQPLLPQRSALPLSYGHHRYGAILPHRSRSFNLHSVLGRLHYAGEYAEAIWTPPREKSYNRRTSPDRTSQT